VGFPSEVVSGLAQGCTTIAGGPPIELTAAPEGPQSPFLCVESAVGAPFPHHAAVGDAFLPAARIMADPITVQVPSGARLRTPFRRGFFFGQRHLHGLILSVRQTLAFRRPEACCSVAVENGEWVGNHEEPCVRVNFFFSGRLARPPRIRSRAFPPCAVLGGGSPSADIGEASADRGSL
jgi:hypothetical protein